MSTNPNPIAQVQNPDAQPTQDAPSNVSTLPDDADAISSTGSVNLARSYSNLNSAVRALFDSLGCVRSATIPHLDQTDMAAHVQDVARACAQSGGITGSLLTATHSQHAEDGGSTVAHRAQSLQETIIPKDCEAAKNAIDAEKSSISKCAHLLGDDNPTVKLAKSQIDLIGKYDMAGMTCFDAGVGLLAIPGPMIQKIAQLHSEHKHGGVHPVLTAPKVS